MASKSTPMKVNPGKMTRQADENTFAPLVDVYETADGTAVLAAELPGARQDSIDIRVDKGVLSISATAEMPPAGEDYTVTYQGFGGGEYFRAFALSDEVDRDRIEAGYADGVLTLKLPRAAAAKTRKIEIKTE